jgi:glycosyltransferase involved in cell wall biosynthesis
MTKRVAIVSSYDEECGAAYYSSRLLKHLTAAGYQVDIKRLPVSLLRMRTPTFVRRKGDGEIARIAREIASYDTVFLQFEPGLYGTRNKISYRRVLELLKAARSVVMTLHGFDKRMTSRSVGGVWQNLAGGRPVEAALNLIEGGLDPIVESFWAYVRRSSHVKVMAFNRSDETLLRRFFDLERIANYPICYFDQDEVAEVRAATDREAFLRRYGLDPKYKYFAVCGFFSAYKGHLSAMKALEFLPEEWRLVIVGGEHPQAIAPDKDIGQYVRQLMAFPLAVDRPIPPDGDLEVRGSLAEVPKLSRFPNLSRLKQLAGETVVRSDHLYRREVREQLFPYSEFKYFFPSTEIAHRIHYLGQATDEEMPRFYAALDYIVHPYVKTKEGQSGSGPATFAVEFGSRALYSNAPVFRDMNHYFDGAMQFFNIGNFMELADQLQRFPHFEDSLSARREAALQRYNPRGMVEAYRTLLDA